MPSIEAGHRKLKVGVIGVGRLGSHHAFHLAQFAPRAELVAICDTDKAARDDTAKKLPSVTVYEDPEDILAHQGLEAIVIATNTNVHSSLAVSALDRGLHVLLEKPISTIQTEAEEVVLAAERNPQAKISIAFSRRFDASYKEAKSRLEELGNVYLVKSATLDSLDTTGAFEKYASTSGGIWIDCGIHDIDLARFFLGVDSNSPGPHPKVLKAFASGTSIIFKGLSNYDDVDNGYGIVEYDNGKSFMFHLSRTNVHGHDVQTEIYGDKGKFVINQVPSKSRVQIADKHGVRFETDQSFWDRFGPDAFITEVNDFVAAVLDDTALPTTVYDGVAAAFIAEGLKLSWKLGQAVYFDDLGRPIVPPQP